MIKEFHSLVKKSNDKQINSKLNSEPKYDVRIVDRQTKENEKEILNYSSMSNGSNSKNLKVVLNMNTNDSLSQNSQKPKKKEKVKDIKNDFIEEFFRKNIMKRSSSNKRNNRIPSCKNSFMQKSTCDASLLNDNKSNISCISNIEMINDDKVLRATPNKNPKKIRKTEGEEKKTNGYKIEDITPNPYSNNFINSKIKPTNNKKKRCNSTMGGNRKNNNSNSSYSNRQNLLRSSNKNNSSEKSCLIRPDPVNYYTFRADNVLIYEKPEEPKENNIELKQTKSYSILKQSLIDDGNKLFEEYAKEINEKQNKKLELEKSVAAYQKKIKTILAIKGKNNYENSKLKAKAEILREQAYTTDVKGKLYDSQNEAKKMQNDLNTLTMETFKNRKEIEMNTNAIKEDEDLIKHFNSENTMLRKQREQMICEIVILNNHINALKHKLGIQNIKERSMQYTVDELIKKPNYNYYSSLSKA